MKSSMTPLYVQILLVKLKDDMRQKDVFVLRYKEPVLQKTFMPTIKGHWKFWGGRGPWKQKIFQEKGKFREV